MKGKGYSLKLNKWQKHSILALITLCIFPYELVFAKEFEVQRQGLIRAFNDSNFNHQMVLDQLVTPDVCMSSVQGFMGCFYATKFAAESYYSKDNPENYPENAIEFDFAGLSPSAIRGRELLRISEKFSLYEKRVELKFEIGFEGIETEDEIRRNVEHLKAQFERVKKYFRDNVVPIIDDADVLLKDILQKLDEVEETKLQSKMARDRGEMEIFRARFEKWKKDYREINLKATRQFYPRVPFLREKFAQMFSDDWAMIWQRAFAQVPPYEKDYFSGLFFNQFLEYSLDSHAKIGLAREHYQKYDQEQVYYGGYFGIGIGLQKYQGKVFLMTVPGGGAEASGLQINDRILQVKNHGHIEKVDPFEITADTNLIETSELIRGEEGIPVTLKIQKWQDGEESQPIDVTIPRGRIKLKFFSSKKINWLGDDYAYLKIDQFAHPENSRLEKQKLCHAIKKEVLRFRWQESGIDRQNPKGWVLDLRNNPGGAASEAACIADLFLEKGEKIYAFANRQPESDSPLYRLSENPPITRAPLVIILNEHSASASELLAGSLMEAKRAFIVGRTSFGKGSTQVNHNRYHPIYRFNRNFSGRKILRYHSTSGYYFFASGKTPENIGIVPDLIVGQSPDGKIPYRPERHEIRPWNNIKISDKIIANHPQKNEIKHCMKENPFHDRAYRVNQKPFDIILNKYQVYSAFNVLACLSKKYDSVISVQDQDLTAESINF